MFRRPDGEKVKKYTLNNRCRMQHEMIQVEQKQCIVKLKRPREHIAVAIKMKP
jgi:hypothetical protein